MLTDSTLVTLGNDKKGGVLQGVRSRFNFEFKFNFLTLFWINNLNLKTTLNQLIDQKVRFFV